MTTMTTAPTATTRPTRAAKAGLVVLGLLGLMDLGSSFDTGGPAPAVILVLGAVTGLVTLGALVPAWRTGNRAAVRAIVISRVVSILASIPVFFVDDLPVGLVAASAAAVLLTVLGLYLVLRRPAA
jgi:hypothetical protein